MVLEAQVDSEIHRSTSSEEQEMQMDSRQGQANSHWDRTQWVECNQDLVWEGSISMISTLFKMLIKHSRLDSLKCFVNRTVSQANHRWDLIIHWMDQDPSSLKASLFREGTKQIHMP